MTNAKRPLPPGQQECPRFYRFGLYKFAYRFAPELESIDINIAGDVAQPLGLTRELLATLPRVEQESDFHCVTTWSVRNLRWGGVKFADFYRQIVKSQAMPEDDAIHVVFRGGDGYSCCMLLEDLLGDDVLLADTLDRQSLGMEHGAPLRLVAPAHYGYKSVKHLKSIEFFISTKGKYRFPQPYPALMDHPRARVAYEERAKYIPGWIIRYIYRPLITSARDKSQKALKKYYASTGNNKPENIDKNRG